MNTSRRNWFLLLLGAVTGKNYIKLPKTTKAKVVEILLGKFKFSSNRDRVPGRAGRTINWYRFNPPFNSPQK